MAKPLHTIRVTVPDGRRVLTRVELDGEDLRGVTRVSFDSGGVNDFSGDREPTITLTLIADVVFEGRLPVDLLREFMAAPRG